MQGTEGEGKEGKGKKGEGKGREVQGRERRGSGKGMRGAPHFYNEVYAYGIASMSTSAAP